jgi:hypothetical protein
MHTAISQVKIGEALAFVMYFDGKNLSLHKAKHARVLSVTNWDGF